MFFKRKKKILDNYNMKSLISNMTLPLVPFGENIMKSDVVMISVDRVASQCAKLKARYIKVDEKGVQSEKNGRLSFLLKHQPNKLMTPYQFIYKVVSFLLLNNNAFVYPVYDKETLETEKLVPLNPTKDDFMSNFKYVPKKEYLPVKKELINLINLVQNEVREYFTFSFEFIGSASRNMITRDESSNVGYDFDVNIMVNDNDNVYSAKEIKQILRAGFDKHSKKFDYDYSEDSKRVITIKVKDTEKSKVLHSCDFAIVNDYIDDNGDEHQEYIHFNKRQNTYEWQEQPDGFYMLPEKIEWIKNNGLWQKVRDRYLNNKNTNSDSKKKSRSIFAETIAQIYNENSQHYYCDDEDEEWGY